MPDKLTSWLAQIIDLRKNALLGTAKILRRELRVPGLWYMPRVWETAYHPRRARELFFYYYWVGELFFYYLLLPLLLLLHGYSILGALDPTQI